MRRFLIFLLFLFVTSPAMAQSEVIINYRASVSTVTVAPKWRSIRAVWSRVGAGSITVVRPGADRPAKMTADFTWAEATGIR